MSADTFSLARQAISGALIEQMFGREGSRWEGDEFKTFSPLRPDSHTGSFAIRKDGCWYDFATGEGGDFIELVGRARSCAPLEAARLIVRHAGCETLQEAEGTFRVRPRVLPLLPVSVSAEDGFKTACDTEGTRKRYGRLVGRWPYHSADGRIAFHVCRYDDSRGGKKVIPWFFGEDRTWRMGQPLPHGRPLFGLRRLLSSRSPVLVVEGEKCATAAVPEGFGFVLTTWSGGAKAVSRTDWTPLQHRDVVVWPDADEPGHEAARLIAANLPQARILRIEGKPPGWDIVDALNEHIDLETFIRSCPIEEGDQGRSSGRVPHLVMRRASAIDTCPVEWLWNGRIPLGEYSVLVGHPSSGKSTLAAALAAHVSAGIPFPDGTMPAVGDVLFLSAEESAAKALVPRLRAAGAALDRVSIADIRLRHSCRSELFSLADGIKPIEAALDELDNPRLLIIDSLTSCTAGIDTFRTDAFGPVLADLAQLSERRNVTTLCLAHFTKAVTSGAMLRVLGSVAVVALARSVYMLARHPDSPRRSLFVPVKNSYALLGEAIELSLVCTAADRLPRIRWGAQVAGFEADSLIALDDVDRRRERSEAMDLLDEALRGGEQVLAHEVYTLGAERGLSKTTIWRATRDRKVEIEGKGRAAKWRLPVVSESFHMRTYADETITAGEETKGRETGASRDSP